MVGPKRKTVTNEVVDEKKFKPSWNNQEEALEREDDSEALDDPDYSPEKTPQRSVPNYQKRAVKSISTPPVSGIKSSLDSTNKMLLSGPENSEYVSVVSVPAPCLLCSDKSGAKLRLGHNNTEVTEHYKLCLYNIGIIQQLVDAGEGNLSEDGSILDPFGERWQYKCEVKDCEKSKRTAKSMSYKEFAFHCYQFHGVLKKSLECARKLAKEGDKGKYDLLLKTIGSKESIGDPKYRIEEIQTCFLCKGLNPDGKENKDAKGMRLNTCVTRNHYALCLHDHPDGKAFFEKTYPLPKDLLNKPSVHQFYCQEDGCKNSKRFKVGVNYKQFATHNALYHGGLDLFLKNHPDEEIRNLIPKLTCSKIPERCFVPDHYGC